MCFCLQELINFAELDSSNDTLTVHYAIETYTRAVKPIIASHERVQHNWASHVLKLDAGFKLCKQGLVTVMSGEGIIMASYCGTSSFWDLAGPLTALGLRSKHLGKVSCKCV